MTTQDKLADAIAARDAAIQQAKIWKMEAQSANATIAEIYRLVGSKAGNWNGANPVREALAEHAAQPAPDGDVVEASYAPVDDLLDALIDDFAVACAMPVGFARTNARAAIHAHAHAIKCRLAQPPASEECFCDRMKLGAAGVSCGDCPTRDYAPRTGRCDERP